MTQYVYSHTSGDFLRLATRDDEERDAFALSRREPGDYRPAPFIDERGAAVIVLDQHVPDGIEPDHLALSRADCLGILEAEQVLLRIIPEDGLPGAQAIFDLFAQAHAYVLATRPPPPSPVDSFPVETCSVAVVSRRAAPL